ncbi:MAG: efflux RND transporter permease subunit [Gemmataceae bacterium]|nr:efflux RND transporter permease subunit [Gemmataceae bacterium]
MVNPVEQVPPSPPSETSEKRASWLVRVSVFNPYLVIVLCLFIGVIGYVCLTRIPVDILPSFKTPAVQVLTLYPGMPTEIMERDITNRIERWTSQSEGIARQAFHLQRKAFLGGPQFVQGAADPARLV